ncbi:MAG: tetratricopeptide repeat protein [Treponema sp.]|jgi:tetratricopeptide (TPR) repeat protein|nr:tetratricopeptide repeat protein [Treponema sp.]
MLRTRSRSDYGFTVHRAIAFKKALAVIFTLLFLCAILAASINLRGREQNDIEALGRMYTSGDYEKAYALSGEELKKEPLDFFLLTIHGFSAFELAVAQINSFDTLVYINDCIWSLRKTFLSRQSAEDGRIFYILGKAYYYKGPEYADLAVKYLEKAGSLSYPARDIPEYLGLAYIAVKDYRGSVAAFSAALHPGAEGSAAGGGEVFEPSDLFLISIARSYLALEETERAKAYLIRCVESSRDSKTVVAARLLLGEIYSKAGDQAAAEVQYLAVIAEIDENAEAHFQLGEIYNTGGDMARARAEWRKAVRLDPSHKPARARLNM